MGSITDLQPPQFGAYGASKAAVNFLMRKVHAEEEWLTSMVICPGWTQTDMGDGAAKTTKFAEQAPIPLDVSITGVVKEVSLNVFFFQSLTSSQYILIDNRLMILYGLRNQDLLRTSTLIARGSSFIAGIS